VRAAYYTLGLKMLLLFRYQKVSASGAVLGDVFEGIIDIVTCDEMVEVSEIRKSYVAL